MLKRYIKNTSGNMSVVFAVSIMALIAGVGAAVDLSGMTSQKSRYQNIADAAVLAAAGSGETDPLVLKQIAQTFVDQNNMSGDALTTTLGVDANGRVKVSVSGIYNTSLMGVFGYDNVNMTTVAVAPLPSSEPVNIALVLDTTWSMSASGKIQALKAAATDLVTSLEAQNNPSLKVAVVPFSQYVNIGLSRRHEVWVDNTTDYTETLPNSCHYPVIGQTNCRNESTAYVPERTHIPQHTCYNDGVPYACGGRSYRAAIPAGSREVCDDVRSTVQVCSPRSRNHVWHGCVGSRLDPWHLRHEFSSREIPGLMNETRCGTELLALTNNMTTVKEKIDSMTVRHETYIPSGLVWGWRALEEEAPLTEAAGPFAAQTKKVMILMTDGVNFLSKTGLTHTGNSASDANDVTEGLCVNINDANVDVYTIAYDVSDVTTRNMLRGCASNPAMYYDASDAAALQAAFEDIGRELVKLRLTQ